ncbi:MAG: AraC family transcriptional regulator [Ignavibacteriaceae bacterium]
MSRYIFSHDEGFRELIDIKFSGCYDRTPYAKKILDNIVAAFPNRFTENEIAAKINISVKWLQHECIKAFDMTYIQLTRFIRIYYALKLFHETNLTTKDIAAELFYSRESSLARDFRKILNISPTNARDKLKYLSPVQILLDIA